MRLGTNNERDESLRLCFAHAFVSPFSALDTSDHNYKHTTVYDANIEKNSYTNPECVHPLFRLIFFISTVCFLLRYANCMYVCV